MKAKNNDVIVIEDGIKTSLNTETRKKIKQLQKEIKELEKKRDYSKIAFELLNNTLDNCTIDDAARENLDELGCILTDIVFTI